MKRNYQSKFSKYRKTVYRKIIYIYISSTIICCLNMFIICLVVYISRYIIDYLTNESLND